MCRLPGRTNGMILSMTLTGWFYAALSDMVYREQMWLRHLTVSYDVATRFGLVPISKTLTLCVDLLEVILTQMSTLYFVFFNTAITSVSSNSSSYAFLTSVEGRVSAAGLGMSIKSSEVASLCLTWLCTGEDGMP